MLCPVCDHDMPLEHDGDGTEQDPYRCARCECVFVMEDGHPLRIELED